MELRVQSLKITTKIDVEFSVIENEILNIKGIVDSKIKPSGESYILTYALDNWASEYDSMVSIMELLASEFSLESEPLFNEDTENVEYDYSKINDEGEDFNDEHFDYVLDEDKEGEHNHEHSSCHSHNHEHNHDHKGHSCSCHSHNHEHAHEHHHEGHCHEHDEHAHEEHFHCQ